MIYFSSSLETMMLLQNRNQTSVDRVYIKLSTDGHVLSQTLVRTQRI